MKVEKLKQILEDALAILEEYEDTDKVEMVSNTYFLGHSNYFLGVAGYNGGYIALDYLEESIERGDE